MIGATLACRPREDPALPARLALSQDAVDGAVMSTKDFDSWFAERIARSEFRVDRVGLDELDAWSFDPDTGNFGHQSGKFFTVEGLRVTVEPLTGTDARIRRWHQPIINQPETGILGIVVKEFDGILHLLMQAKMEPGNPNLLQLSPTVQATRSNYTGVHRGAKVRYLEYFLDTGRGRVIADVLQSEHGAWFYRKANRNMVVEVTEEVPPHEDFCWLTLGQLARLLHRDNLVNMDSRTALSCLPIEDPSDGAWHSDAEVLSWLTGEHTRYDVRAKLMPLRGLPDWISDGASISRADGRFFRVVGVSVRADTREVSRWTQPLLEPVGRGIVAFLTRQIGGVPHVLASARGEGGFLDTVELGPTVQCIPDNLPYEAGNPPFLDVVMSADPRRVRYSAVHSEEGGRFLNAESRYMVIEATEAEAPIEAPPGFRWVTPGQLTSLVTYGRRLNVQARTLLTCLNAMRAGT